MLGVLQLTGVVNLSKHNGATTNIPVIIKILKNASTYVPRRPNDELRKTVGGDFL